MDNIVVDFVQNLISGSPELAEIHRQHMAEQGELLPHVLMGEITRLVIASTSDDESATWRSRLLEDLESGLLSGSKDVAELVGVSFVENLCGEIKAIEALRPGMGLALRREVKTICGGN